MTGEELNEYDLTDVKLVSEKRLDALEIFDGRVKTEQLETSLRQDIAALTEPTYMFGWE